MSEIAGDDRYFDLRASLGYEGHPVAPLSIVALRQRTFVLLSPGLKDDVARYAKEGEGALSCLVPDLRGIDPDDAFSSVPYEKGCALLRHLELRIGKQPFRAFFKAYIEEFSPAPPSSRLGLPVTSDRFRRFFEAHCAARGLGAAVASVDWEAWYFNSSLPTCDVLILN